MDSKPIEEPPKSEETQSEPTRELILDRTHVYRRNYYYRHREALLEKQHIKYCVATSLNKGVPPDQIVIAPYKTKPTKRGVEPLPPKEGKKPVEKPVIDPFEFKEMVKALVKEELQKRTIEKEAPSV